MLNINVDCWHGGANLKKTYTIPFSPPDIGENEINGVIEVLKSGWITTGPKTKLFENKIASYCNLEGAVCLNSATACLELVLRLFDIKEGDEVITSAYTYTASASVIEHVGAKIVLVDTAPNSFFMDYDKLEKAITSKTKAIIPVDIAGVICDYDKVIKIAEKAKFKFKANNDLQKALGRILVMADAAHSFGATHKGKISGQLADFTCFSFHAVKNLTTAEGGAVVWRDIKGIENKWIYSQFMLMSLHGQSKDALAKTQLGSWEYDIIKTAYKCNMTDIMAAIGLAQLDRYESLLLRRKEIVNRYEEGFKNSKVLLLNHYNDIDNSSGHLCLTRIENVTVEQRNAIIIKLAEKGISSNVHYKPLPMHTAYINYGFNIQDFPNAYNQYKNEITLPLHTKLTDDEVDYIICTLLEVVNVL